MIGFTDAFIKQAQATPDAIAILTNGVDAFTYHELWEQAQTIAAHLPGPEAIIALHIEKSTAYIAALLGCWLAGAAFLPLDPALPPERKDFILNDARPDVVLTREKIETFKPSAFKPAPLLRDTRAYIIYTSGSTGQPKGVVVGHGGLVSMLDAQIKAFGLKPGSKSLFYLSTNFDASVSDIGTALLSGATLCIEDASRLDIARNMPSLIKERGITYADIPPSFLKILKPTAMPHTLETIVIGGEVCPPEVVRDWARHFRIINVYGPTEATVCTSMCVCDPETWDKPLIGNPLPDVEYMTLNGELLISGAQLALGYLNRPELTAQKFVMHEGKRWYRTGDLVHRHADGTLEFLGRIDRQVKLRGQLVELEEIETHLITIQGVSRAAVLKRAVEGRDTLVAFVCMEKDARMGTDVLKTMLKPVLPEWMIPTFFEVLDHMPLTAAGKINLNALLDYPVTKPALSSAKREAETDLEKQILGIWQRILKRQDIGCADNFFLIGGDSMAVLELSMEADMHGLPITPAMVVECPTIEAQAVWFQTKNIQMPFGSMTAEALKKDVALDEAWIERFALAESRPFVHKHVQKIFFTGATGFLGAQLLHSLLKETTAMFYVLVRAESDSQAMARLSLPVQWAGRVVALCGDFTEPDFGLQADVWNKLAAETDTIIHCGAVVNMVAPYKDLRCANVEATQEIIRLACEGQRKWVHYASTLSVFVSTNQNTGTVYETDRLEGTKNVYGGYGQSKWAAEYFLQQVPESACDISIYRLGLITGDTATGRCANRDFLNMFIKGLVSLGSVPDGLHQDLMVDVTPVDFAAQAMSQLICGAGPGTYHIANTRGFSLADIMRGLGRLGKPLNIIDPAAWRDSMKGRTLSPQESASFMALCRCLPGHYMQRYGVMDLFQATGMVFDSTGTDKILSQSGLNIPHANDALLDLYLRYILGSA